MIAVDTNVIVRFLTGDDPSRSARAVHLIENHPVSVSTAVLVECEWVLRREFGFDRDRIYEAFTALLGIETVSPRDSSVIVDALGMFREGFDFADAVHLVQARGCRGFATFDDRLAKKAQGRQDCPEIVSL